MWREFVRTLMAVPVFLCGVLTAALCVLGAPLWLKITLLLLALPPLGVLLKMELTRDKVPDYLRTLVRGYFGRYGFCFAVVPLVHDGVCWLSIYFQNRYERACVAIVAIKPSLEFFLNKHKLDPVRVRIECGPAGFGIAYVPWPFPLDYQGKIQRLDVGASVQYPQGRGQMLRFRNGHRVGRADFHNNSLTRLLRVAVALCAHLHVRLRRPAYVKFKLPENVGSGLPEGVCVEVDQFWKLGDPELDLAAIRESFSRAFAGTRLQYVGAE